MKLFRLTLRQLSKKLARVAHDVSDWWLNRNNVQMSTIAIICSLLLPLLTILIHSMLKSVFSETFANMLMFFACVIVILTVLLSLTSILKNNRKLEQLSMRDPLTNLYNRRFLHDELHRLKRQMRRDLKEGRIVSLVLIFMDLDGLKTINDNHNHKAGDDALCATAGIINEGIRDGEDLLARYAGDEFCVAILVRKYATKYEMLRQIASFTYRTKKNIKKAIFYYGSKRIPLSITIGSHIVDIKENDIMAELERADEKMLEKKKRRKTARVN